MFRKFLRYIKKVLPDFLPVPYFYKKQLNFLILPKHHWTQYLQKTYEPETFEKLKKIFRNNKIKSFWDIGANVGIYSVFISKKYNCSVNAFEPSLRYYKFLKANTSQFKKVFLHNFGIGSENNKKFIILTEEPGSNYISKNSFKEKNSELCDLKSINNLSKIEPPCLVKIDVEGYEYEILNNSIDYFKSNKTILIIEIDEEHLKRYSKNKRDIFNLLKSRNYLIKRIANSNNYYCSLSEHDKTWIEFIGIWGAGKSTAIKKLKSDLKNYVVCKTTLDFFKLSKLKRLFFTLINI